MNYSYALVYGGPCPRPRLPVSVSTGRPGDAAAQRLLAVHVQFQSSVGLNLILAKNDSEKSQAASRLRLRRPCWARCWLPLERQWGARRAAFAPREFRPLWDCLSRFHRRLFFCDGRRPARCSRARAAPQSSPGPGCAGLRLPGCPFRPAQGVSSCHKATVKTTEAKANRTEVIHADTNLIEKGSGSPTKAP